MADDQAMVEMQVFELDSLKERVSGKPFDVQKIAGLPRGPAGSYPIEVTFEYSVDQRLTITVAIPSAGIRRRWQPRHERDLADRRPESQQRVDTAFGDALGSFRKLAERTERALAARPDATRTAAALDALRDAMNACDAAACTAAKNALLEALFDDQITLGA
ncbi:MAG: hypothetical protein HMLKMBBP_00140 [Planctomycetes bacterium]|nr:hypothetical protein [Planctomycetota bacterium]